jgi:hypothetical protein
MVLLQFCLPIVKGNEANQTHTDPLDESARLRELVHRLEEELLNTP